MRAARQFLPWVVAGLVGAALLVWGFPRAFPLMPRDWQLSKREATALGLERLRVLGDPVVDPYVVAILDGDTLIENRLRQALDQHPAGALRESPLGQRVYTWVVMAYDAGAQGHDWTYRATLALSGAVIGLELRLPSEVAGAPLDPALARSRAAAFLREQGIDLGAFREPEVRTQKVRDRTDTTVRYPYREQLLGESSLYGVDVTFGGDRLTGFKGFFEDPSDRAMRAALQPISLLSIARILSTFLWLPIVAVPFLRRYHAGEIGVKRGLQILGVVYSAAVLLMILCARTQAEDVGLGVLTRQQTTWAVALQFVLLFFLPLSLLAFLCWSVGESLCRERWGYKLAAFDALFQGRWGTATLARSALRGTAAGMAVAGGSFAVAALLSRFGAYTLYSLSGGPWWHGSPWMGLGLLLFALVFSFSGELLGRLFLLPMAVNRFGRWGGAAVTAPICAVMLWAGLVVLPLGWALLMALLVAIVQIILFLRYDLLTSMVAGFVAAVVIDGYPLVLAHDPSVQFQGCLAFLGAALPMLLSVRHLLSGEEFVYRYDDVPPHVRRIAERERQRVELETARGIQSSILPDLPPQLGGMEIAHTYLPASEVGGDFYDVLALEDGRLAVAVGDVAGHGVSSGLVMSMAKSALAVQVTFDPEVAAVFTTLNRVVHQSARKRLLATLVYALVDPQRHEMFYASAGHLFPYRVGHDGRVEPLESVAYPLGVRRDLEVRVRSSRLESGDSLVMFSDGVVEARAEGSEEMFGFERLEQSLARHAGENPSRLRDKLLEDLAEFTGGAPREDDLTLLVLRMPA